MPAKRAAARRPARLGIALGPNRVVAVRAASGRFAPWGGEEVQRRSLEPPMDDGRWPDLTEAVAELRASSGARRLTLDVALQRPLACAKVLAVPPLRGRALRDLVQRNARRYFPVGLEAAVADARLVGRRGSVPRPVLAAYASDAAVASITSAIEAADARVESITPASLALVEAICSRVRRIRRGHVVLLASWGDAMDVLYLDRGVPRLIQPISRTSPDDEAVLMAVVEAVANATASLGRAEGLIVCGDDEGERFTAYLEESLASAGDVVPPMLDEPSLRATDAAALAALGATWAGCEVPSLLPEALRLRACRRARRRTTALSAAAAALVTLTAGLHVVGVHRELRAVEARRRVLAPAVAEALAARQAVEGVRSRLAAVEQVERTQVRMTEALTALTSAMPDSAYLVSFSATGAQLHLGGAARSASAIIPALESSPLFTRATFAAPLRREEATGLERFTVAVRFTVDSAGPSAAVAEKTP